MRLSCPWVARFALLLLAAVPASTSAQPLAEPHRWIYPEQRHLQARQPDGIWRVQPPNLRPPITVSVPDCDGERFALSLDESILIALSNAEVIRFLGGSSGRTVYDPAITNAEVDVQRSVFDPAVTMGNFYEHNESFFPQRVPDPFLGPDVALRVNEFDRYSFSTAVSQRKTGGATASVGLDVDPIDTDPAGILDPQTPASIIFGYNQPLLRGRGKAVNLAPVVIARLDTERSFYQLKDSVQEMVRGVVEGYWSIVAARVSVWATKQQIEQLEVALDFFEAQHRVGRADLGDTAQARVSLANFRANLISVEADLLNREALFRNLLGLPPVDQYCLYPTTPPLDERQSFDWQQLIAVAEQRRPDIIDLKLQIDSDEQNLLVANNNALPTVDAVANRRMDSLSGRNTITGANVSRFGANFLQLGLQVDLPLGLRADRARLRQAELSLARDRAILRQQLHAVTHVVAQNIRSLDQFYDQYEAFKKVREAARLNLDRRFDFFRTGGIPTERVTYVEVLLAVTDWGNAVSSEANSLALYNIELATLQRQIGTIIEDHGVRFYEELYGSKGPKLDRPCYPESIRASDNQPQYEVGDEPSEDFFDLESRVTESGGGDEEDEDARARRLRDTLPPPRRVEPLEPREPAPPSQVPDRPPILEPAPVQPAEPPPQPPEEGRIPGDDLKQLLDQMQEIPNPFKEPDEE
jgi:outer membrane protein TolC